MAVKYDVYKTPATQGAEETTYHVRAKHAGMLTMREITSGIEHDTSLTEGDVLGVLASLSHVLATALGTGKRVYLEGIGYFSLAVDAPSVTSPRDMRAEYVQVKGVSYRPDKVLKKRLSAVKFEREQQKSHSLTLTDKEVKERLDLYFATHVYLRRADFERLCGFARTTAIRRLNALLEEGFLKRDGGPRAAVYLKA